MIDDVVSLLLPLKKEIVDAEEEKKQIEPLYQRLGGAPAINAVVDGMYEKIFSDPSLSDFFKKTDHEHQKNM
jgi:truncated hemoglobin YjbI